MKKILLSCLFFSAFGVLAQEIQPTAMKVEKVETPVNMQESPSRSVTCGVDTVQYNMAKSTGFQAISINNATSAFAFCQYFDCPQDITIHGADFVAYKTDSNGGDTIDVTVNLYNASADSLPWGAPLATTVVQVDINTWFLNMDDLRKHAEFPTPVTVSQPYVIAVINNSPNAISMWGSDYQVGDGLGEHLGSARIGFNWVRGYDINVGGNPYDADMFIYPWASYDLDAEIFMDPNCVTGVNNITTTNLSSPVLFNRFYSQEAFNGTAGNQCTWDWGDASPTETGTAPTHTYGGGIFMVTLTDTLVGWDMNCIDVDSLSTCAPPIADFEAVDTMCVYDCLQITNNSVRGDTWAWTFDGGTPASWSAQDPDTICWSTPGTYDIELIVSNQAGADTMTHTIYIDNCGVGMDENDHTDLLIYPNPSSNQITLQAGDNMNAVQLFDLSGKLIYNDNFNATSVSVVDVQSLPIGIYAIRIQFEDGTIANRRIEVIR